MSDMSDIAADLRLQSWRTPRALSTSEQECEEIDVKEERGEGEGGGGGGGRGREAMYR